MGGEDALIDPHEAKAERETRFLTRLITPVGARWFCVRPVLAVVLLAPMVSPVTALELVRPEQDALLDRLAQAQVKTTVRGIPLRGLNVALLRHLGAERSQPLRQQLRLENVPLTSRRSVVEFLQFELIVARAIGDRLGSFERGVEACGAGAMQLFFDSRAGQAMIGLAGQDPHRMLTSTPVAFQFMFDFGRRHWRATGERSGMLDCAEDFLGPAYTFGFIALAVERYYGVQLQPGLVQRDLLNFSLQLSW